MPYKRPLSFPVSFPRGHPLYTFEPIPNCDNGYYINHEGKVWSETSKLFINPSTNDKGYLQFKCYPSKKIIKIHQAVAKVFLGEPDSNINDPVVNHIDHERDNNIADNLEWMTSKKNQSNQQKTNKHSSQFIGVSFYKKRNKKWGWELKHNGERIREFCDTEEEAKDARNAYIIKHNLDLMLN